MVAMSQNEVRTDKSELKDILDDGAIMDSD